MKKFVTILIVLFVKAICVGDVSAANTILKFKCTSDASAAVAVDGDTFVVADDENNILKFYKTTGNTEPVYSFNLNRFLGIDPKHPEADIEGAARIGDRIYWITSHGRNKDGKPRVSRYQFFATDIEKQGSDTTLKSVGSSCFDLVHKMVKDKKLESLNLDRATSFYDLKLTKAHRKLLAPKKQGLNIEGLCSSADGKSLYIGFRNPQHQRKAIVIQLLNPAEVIEKMANPKFGEPILWDLKSRGIRSFEYSQCHKAYFIIAGPAASKPSFSLYKWSGQRSSQPKLLKQTFPASFTPEALVVFDSKPEMLVLSDDGTIEVEVESASQCMEGQYIAPGKCLNKHLIIPQKQTFKAMWINP